MVPFPSLCYGYASAPTPISPIFLLVTLAKSGTQPLKRAAEIKSEGKKAGRTANKHSLYFCPNRPFFTAGAINETLVVLSRSNSDHFLGCDKDSRDPP